MSEEGTKHDCLTAALVAAQAEFPPLERSSTVNIKTKSGASFNYSYASLDTLRGQTDSILHKYKLVVNHRTRIEGDRIILVSQLSHGNEQQTAEWPVGSVDDDPKDLGANMTYGMRYTYSALTGRVAEDDSDAQRTTAPAKKQPAPPVPDKQPDAKEEFNPDNMDNPFGDTTPKDSLTLARESCMARFTELGIDDAWCKEWLMAQYELKESRNEMAEEQWRDARKKLDESVTKADGMLEGQVIVLNKHLTELGYTGPDDPNFLAKMKTVKSLAGITVGNAVQVDPKTGALLIGMLWNRVKFNRKAAKEKAND